ncbi:MAG TPA: tetratricopeptide repeat protein [Anaerolineales bacterium]|nr:tetratricopeptide repeat protein [Anaerolineales bacterium]
MKTNQARAHALITQADDLRQRGKLDDAIVAYREAIRLVPAFGTLNLVIGDMLFQRQRPAEAAEAFQTVLELMPNHDQAWSRLGQCQLLLGQPEAAFGAFEKALAISSNDVEANYYLAILYMRRGEQKKSIPHLRQALRLRPEWETQARKDKFLSPLVDEALPSKKGWAFWKR